MGSEMCIRDRVLTSPNPNSYSIPYDGPLKSAFEKWLPFTKGK